MGFGRGKSSKSKKSKKKKKEEVSSSSESDSESYSSDSSYSSSSDSEPETAKRQRLASTSSKKKHKKEKKKEEKKRKKEAKSSSIDKISKDDYYHKSTEFRLWLVEEKGKYFDQLSSSKSKRYFKKFIKRWNTQGLSKKYYKGIDMADARASLTKYKWKFAEKIKESATPSPTAGKFKVPAAWKSTPTAMTPPQRTFSTFGKERTQSRSAADVGPVPERLQLQPALSAVSMESIGPSRPVQGPMRQPVSLTQAEEEDLRDAKRRQLRQGRKDFNDYNKMVLDELTPKATGHDAKVEKRLARAQSRSQRDLSPGLSDASYMGTGGDDIHKRLAARQRQRDNRSVKGAQQIEDYQAKEKAKMSRLLELARANKSKDALW